MKEHYKEIYNKKWKKCLRAAEDELGCDADEDSIYYEAMDIFEETANAEEIVGYYLVIHGEKYSLQDWRDNIKGKEKTDQDIEIDRILNSLLG